MRKVHGDAGCTRDCDTKHQAAMLALKIALFLFALLYLSPLGISALLYRMTGAGADSWPADRSKAALPPNAIGKDYPYDGRWLRWAPSGTGIRMTLGGYAGLTVAWVEGIEVNILGAIAGLDLRRPALKLPGFGRIGMSAANGPAL